MTQPAPRLPPPVGTVTLGWDPSDSPEVSGYVIYWGPVGDAFQNRLDAGLVTNVTIFLATGVLYYFQAGSYDVFGNESSAYSAPVSTNVPAVTAPTNPEYLVTLTVSKSLVATGAYTAIWISTAVTTNAMEYYSLAVDITNWTWGASSAATAKRQPLPPRNLKFRSRRSAPPATDLPPVPSDRP
jgi:hypothetical protein